MLRENHRLGIEPATGKSQVQRPTAEPPRNTTQPPPADLRRRAIRRRYSGLTQQSQPMTTTSTKFPRRMRITNQNAADKSPSSTHLPIYLFAIQEPLGCRGLVDSTSGLQLSDGFI